MAGGVKNPGQDIPRLKDFVILQGAERISHMPLRAFVKSVGGPCLLGQPSSSREVVGMDMRLDDPSQPDPCLFGLMQEPLFIPFHDIHRHRLPETAAPVEIGERRFLCRALFEEHLENSVYLEVNKV
jgi:hypothetical protein